MMLARNRYHRIAISMGLSRPRAEAFTVWLLSRLSIDGRTRITDANVRLVIAAWSAGALWERMRDGPES